MPIIVVEKMHDKPFDDEAWEAADARLGPCLEARSIRWLRSLVSHDRKRTVCEFEAPDAETVREAHRMAGLACDRVYPAQVVTP